MAEERAETNEERARHDAAETNEERVRRDELTDADLHALFDELRLDIPDPPSEFTEGWVMGELILDPFPRECEFITHTEQGVQRRVCTEHEEDCDVYAHAVWRADCGRTVRNLARCTWHVDRVTGRCRLCRVDEDWSAVDISAGYQSYSLYRQPQRVRGRKSRRARRGGSRK